MFTLEFKIVFTFTIWFFIHFELILIGSHKNVFTAWRKDTRSSRMTARRPKAGM